MELWNFRSNMYDDIDVPDVESFVCYLPYGHESQARYRRYVAKGVLPFYAFMETMEVLDKKK